MRPRITIYPFNDTTYSTQLYSYNGFTDTGSAAKPISLQFEGTVSGAGTFSIEIEDSDGTLDPESFIKGNRIFIEMSKDGSIWQPAFKGLVRSCERFLFGAKGSNFTIRGYSYLIRFNERILNVIKQSSLTGPDYNRTDSTMFTDNLINDLLTTDTNYIYGIDDTQQYSLFKTTNITSSLVDNWIPRLDAQLVTVADAINSVLEFGNGVITIDPSNDQLVLFDPQQVTTGTGIFLVTDQPNLIADNAAYTMYPVEPYKYTVSYDYPDSGSRLIASIGSVQCPETTITSGGGGTRLDVWDNGHEMFLADSGFTQNAFSGPILSVSDSPLTSIAVGVATLGTMTGTGLNVLNANLVSWTTANLTPNWPPFITNIPLYVNGVSGTAWPNQAAGVRSANFIMKTAPGWGGASLGAIINPSTQKLVIMFSVASTVTQNSNNHILLGERYPFYSVAGFTYHGFFVVNQGGSTWLSNSTSAKSDALLAVAITVGSDAPPGGGTTTIPPCGGLPQLADADPLFAVAQDKNMSARLGVVERVVSDLPSHIRTKQTMDEFLFNKLFTASKPRFVFDYPAVTIPNTVPKAGDICAHVSQKAKVGTKRSPLQVGVILSVNYDFNQDDEGVFSLTKMGLSTTGIRRGYY